MVLPPRTVRAGAARLRLALALAALSVLAGAAVPIASGLRTRGARAATRAQLELLAGAASQHFRDVGALPTSLDALELDPGLPGWAGPYVGPAGSRAPRVDAWSRAYALASRGDRLTLASAGPDARRGSDDDVVVTLDVTPIRRARTLLRLSIVNRAIALYNGEHQASDPLPADWPRALDALVARGYLPRADDFLLDGWGSPLREDPPGLMPVVRVASVHLPAAGAGRPR